MKKLLIVEDDRLVANIYSGKFRGEGWQTAVAMDGEAAMQGFTTMKPDVVLLDLGIPKTNGLEVLRWIRRQPGSGSTPVVVFTNAYSPNMLEQAWSEGATNCLIKSSSTPKQVSDAVRQALDQAARSEGQAPPQPAPGDAPISPPASPAAAPRPQTAQEEAGFIAELRQSFVNETGRMLADLRAMAQKLAREQHGNQGPVLLQDLYRKVHSINSNAAIVGFHQIARFAAAVELLIKEMYEQPRHLTQSTLRTLGQSLDFLGVVFTHAASASAAMPSGANILAVDDEIISRRAVSYALERVQLKCLSIEDSNLALSMIGENQFDLIILDVDMPGTDGLQLCRHIRQSARNEKTPVVFVTSITSFETRVASVTSGGDDLIAKPFLFIELGLKALMHLMRSEIRKTAK